MICFVVNMKCDPFCCYHEMWSVLLLTWDVIGFVSELTQPAYNGATTAAAAAAAGYTQNYTKAYPASPNPYTALYEEGYN